MPGNQPEMEHEEVGRLARRMLCMRVPPATHVATQHAHLSSSAGSAGLPTATATPIVGAMATATATPINVGGTELPVATAVAFDDKRVAPV